MIQAFERFYIQDLPAATGRRQKRRLLQVRYPYIVGNCTLLIEQRALYGFKWLQSVIDTHYIAMTCRLFLVTRITLSVSDGASLLPRVHRLNLHATSTACAELPDGTMMTCLVPDAVSRKNGCCAFAVCLLRRTALNGCSVPASRQTQVILRSPKLSTFDAQSGKVRKFTPYGSSGSRAGGSSGSRADFGECKEACAPVPWGIPSSWASLEGSSMAPRSREASPPHPTCHTRSCWLPSPALAGHAGVPRPGQRKDCLNNDSSLSGTAQMQKSQHHLPGSCSMLWARMRNKLKGP